MFNIKKHAIFSIRKKKEEDLCMLKTHTDRHFFQYYHEHLKLFPHEHLLDADTDTL